MKASTLTLEEIAQRIGAEVHGDSACLIHGLATLQEARAGELSFLANPNYARFLAGTQASAVIVSPAQLADCRCSALVMKNPYVGYARASRLFDPLKPAASGVDARAIVDQTAKLAEGVSVAAGAVIGAGVEIGANTRVGPGCIVGDDVRIGADCLLHGRVTVYHQVTIADRVIVHSGAVLGADGFGFAPEAGRFEKIAQLGSVVIESDVEIGANTTIDRGALGNTVIREGVKLDNQIQIAHNVVIGANTVIAACTGVSGSTTVGANCMIGGGVGIAGHLNIADGVHLTGMTLVTHDLTKPGVYSSGTAVEENRSWRKNVARFRQLDQWIRRLQSLEKRS